MKTNYLSFALLFSAGLFAQTANLSPYKEKTKRQLIHFLKMKTEHLLIVCSLMFN